MYHHSRGQKVDCPREMPWGPSESVNHLRFAREGEPTSMEIEMQSGDTLRTEGDAFELA
jgi:hypothetical protein